LALDSLLKQEQTEKVIISLARFALLLELLLLL
jgi:hypothetical protein